MQAIPQIMYSPIIYYAYPVINPNFMNNQNPQGISYIAIPQIPFIMNFPNNNYNNNYNANIPNNYYNNNSNNNFSLYNNNNQIIFKNEQSKIKQNEVEIKMRELFINNLNLDLSFEFIFNTLPEKCQEFFDLKIDMAFKRYKEKLKEYYIKDKIYLKK